MNRAPSNMFFSDRPEVPVMVEANPVVSSENSPLMVGARNNDDECTTDNCTDRCSNGPNLKVLCVIVSSAAGLILGLKIGALTTTSSGSLGLAGCCVACSASFFAVGGGEACQIAACPSSINPVPPSMLEPNNSLSR